MIPLDGLDRRPYPVLGLGLSGRATVRALLAAGHTVWAWDDNPAARAAAAVDGAPLVDLHRHDLSEAAALILSPGIPHTHPQPHPVADRARAAGLSIVGDVELLFRAQPNATWIGITGTNGKSTTTALIGHILAAAGREVRVGGNLGTPVLSFAPVHPTGIYVVEMSSYQLELTPSVVFNIAVLLNISPDHLGRHGGMDGYVAAKRRILQGRVEGGVAVVGVDDAHCREMCVAVSQGGERRLLVISGQRRVGGGAFADDGLLWDAIDHGAKPVLEMSDAVALPGTHNGQNAAAAYAACRALGLDVDTVADAIASFPGLAHRQERIAAIRSVTYVNDSKATNADAAIRALACYQDVYWIAGGRPKEDGLAGIDPWLDRVRGAFLIGEAEADFARALVGKVPVERCGTLERAFEAARAAAERDRSGGAVVLLSPACASFDQFRNFEERGDAFRALVEGIRR